MKVKLKKALSCILAAAMILVLLPEHLRCHNEEPSISMARDAYGRMYYYQDATVGGADSDHPGQLLRHREAGDTITLPATRKVLRFRAKNSMRFNIDTSSTGQDNESAVYRTMCAVSALPYAGHDADGKRHGNDAEHPVHNLL
jgi:hypothetical protein